MKRSRPRIQTINGVKNEIIYASEVDGFVTEGYKTLFIHDEREPRRVLESAIHEVAHRCEPKLSHVRITRMSENVSNLLWRMGYRRLKGA